jgi:hypothetical protein
MSNSKSGSTAKGTKPRTTQTQTQTYHAGAAKTPIVVVDFNIGKGTLAIANQGGTGILVEIQDSTPSYTCQLERVHM